MFSSFKNQGFYAWTVLPGKNELDEPLSGKYYPEVMQYAGYIRVLAPLIND